MSGSLEVTAGGGRCRRVLGTQSNLAKSRPSLPERNFELFLHPQGNQHAVCKTMNLTESTANRHIVPAAS